MRKIDKRAGISSAIPARGYLLARSRRAMLGRRVALLSVFCLTLAVAPVHSREHKKHEDFGMGLSTEVAAPEREVLEAVEAIVDNGIIQGSFEYNKDKYIDKANAVDVLVVVSRMDGTGHGFLQGSYQGFGAGQFQGNQGRRHAGGALCRAEQRRRQNNFAHRRGLCRRFSPHRLIPRMAAWKAPSTETFKTTLTNSNCRRPRPSRAKNTGRKN